MKRYAVRWCWSGGRRCPLAGRQAAVVVTLAVGMLGMGSRLEAAQNASDHACSGYSGGGDWTGVNGGSGFGPWTNKVTGGGGGFFRWTSTENAGGSSGGIDTSCSGNFAWGMYANGSTPGTHFARVSRPFTAGSTPTNILQVGQVFAIDFDNGWIESGGSQGFALQNSSGEDVLQFRFLGGTCCYQINGSSPSPTIGFTGNGLRVRVILTSPTDCTVQVQTPNTSTSTNTYTGVALLDPGGGRAISQVQLFVNGSGSGANYNGYFNSMSISCPSFSVSAPTHQAVCAGATATFTVSAPNAATPTYQWQFSSDSGSTWLNVTNGTGGSTASFTTGATTLAQNGWQFRCVVTDACGNVQNSDAATLTVHALPTAGNDTLSRSWSLGLKIPKTTLLTNDSSGASLASVSSPTANGIALTVDANYIYYPANATNLNDSFSYTITNSAGCAAAATVTVNVAAQAAAQALSVEPGGGSVTVRFAGIPGYPYAIERATNVAFTLGTNTWLTNAPTGGLFQISDDFTDLGGPPAQAFYRLRYNP